MTSRGRKSRKLGGGFSLSITSIVMMLITILVTLEDRCSISFAKKNACYVHIDMHPLAAASRSRLLETEPKLFVFETS